MGLVSKKKGMICHKYFGSVYIDSRPFESVSETTRFLREHGARFRANRLQNLGDESAKIEVGDFTYEVEESL